MFWKGLISTAYFLKKFPQNFCIVSAVGRIRSGNPPVVFFVSFDINKIGLKFSRNLSLENKLLTKKMGVIVKIGKFFVEDGTALTIRLTNQ